MSTVNKSIIKIVKIDVDFEAYTFEKQVLLPNLAQLLPIKKLSANARAQISSLSEGNHPNSNYICNGQQNPLFPRNGFC